MCCQRKPKALGVERAKLPGVLSISALPLAGCFATGGSLFSVASWYPSRRAVPLMRFTAVAAQLAQFTQRAGRTRMGSGVPARPSAGSTVGRGSSPLV